MDRVTAAMQTIDRRLFLPPRERPNAGVDAPLPIGCRQTNSQPRTVEAMLRLLDVRPGQRVLDVGAGSGWSTALLGTLTGPDGRVLGVELEPTLARWGAGNLAQVGLPHAEIRPALPGVLGWPDEAPYDRILVSAAAKALPQPLLDQLAPDGVLVMPVRSTMVRVTNRPGRDPEVSEHGGYAFVPLRDHPDGPG
jgi:protein-L-isoaspartate(D-aspartate) O-methyltransferase